MYEKTQLPFQAKVLSLEQTVFAKRKTVRLFFALGVQTFKLVFITRSTELHHDGMVKVRLDISESGSYSGISLCSK
ncbi:MAG: hypothetical protein NC408_04345 [Candidatus Gastranaerophilales bacterium]|nr:hypothetical protein [Candidatus Gastranaerophilales bacterium]